MVTWSCRGFKFALVTTSTFLKWGLTELIFEDNVYGIVSHVSQRIGILRLVKRDFVDTSVLLRCYYSFVLPIFEYCSPVWGSAAKCHLQLLERHVYSVVRLYCRSVIDFMLLHCVHILYTVNLNSNHCLFSELPSASVRVRQTRAAAAAHPLEFEVSRCRTSQFARCFLPAQTRVWNDLPYTVFDTRTLDEFKWEVDRWLLSWFFFLFSVAQVLVGLRKKFINNFVFPTLACAAGFNNNNNNKNIINVKHYWIVTFQIKLCMYLALFVCQF